MGLIPGWGQASGAGVNMLDPYVQGVLPYPRLTPGTAVAAGNTFFTIHKCENGYLVTGGDKSYVATDIDGILDSVKLILVSAALESAS